MPFFVSKKSSKAKKHASTRGFLSTVQVAERDFPLENDNLEYKNSSTAGVGVFNKTIIPKGKKLLEFTGEIIETKKEMEKKILNYKRFKHISQPNIFKINHREVYVDATTVGSAGRYINYSCNPNCIAKQLKIKNKINISALVQILPNTELTIDYGLQSGAKCLCGSSNYRGKMWTDAS